MAEHVIIKKEELYVLDLDPAEIAEKRGLKVVYPKPNEFQLDIDSQENMDNFYCRINDIEKLGFDIRFKRTKSKTEGNYHITASIDGIDELSEWQRIALQFMFGSDYKREVFNGLRQLLNISPIDRYEMVMTWGKYQGKTIEEIPSGYLLWIRDESDCGDELRDAAAAELDFRTKHKTHFRKRGGGRKIMVMERYHLDKFELLLSRVYRHKYRAKFARRWIFYAVTDLQNMIREAGGRFFSKKELLQMTYAECIINFYPNGITMERTK